MTEVNHRRIATNTLLLYTRMIIVTLVGLYTSRVIINALGKEYYGIYDAVGGIVLMTSFISDTMSSACQRWYSFEMGRGNFEQLKRIFSISVTIFFVTTILIAIISEIAGIWFLESKIDKPEHLEPARWVFQFSILAFCINILKLPYQSMVIAKEKMKVFAYISFIEVFATLAIAIILAHTNENKESRLILYSGMMVGIQILISASYWLYCRIFYTECRFSFILDTAKFKEMFSYAGWNLIGSFADVCKNYGLSLLLFSCFGTIISAARGIANKVYCTIRKLNTDYFSAVRPQLVKSYAAGERDDMRNLICQSTRITFFLLFIAAMPIIMEIHFILPVWLRGENVPDEAYIFTQLMIADGLLNCFTSPLSSSVQATGKVRNYQICIGLTLLMILPLAYIGINYYGFEAASVFVVSIAVTFVAQILRVYFVHKQVGLDIGKYLKSAVLPIVLVVILSAGLSVLVKLISVDAWGDDSVVKSLVVIGSSILITGLSIFFIGLTSQERKKALDLAIHYIHPQKQETDD